MKLSDKTRRMIRNAALVLLGLVVVYGIATGQISLFGAQGSNGTDNSAGQSQIQPADTGTSGTSNGGSGQTPDSSGSTAETGSTTPAAASATDKGVTVYEDGTYSSKAEVALYIHAFGYLPANFITKEEAEALGWEGGSLEPYAPRMSIGGDWFGNYEGLLPKAKGRTWHECDIDTTGKSSRGGKRIVYSSDGLIYYTSDHYESFTQLY